MSRTSKTPPHSLEAERAVLGAVFRDNEALVKVQAVLALEDFYQDAHRLIFTAMEEMVTRSQPVDLVTLGDTLHGRGHLDTIGGVTYLSQLIDATPTAGNVRHYAKIVKNRADLRSLRRSALEVIDLVGGDGADGSDGELLARARDLMSQAVDGVEKDEAQPLVRLIRARELKAPPVEWLVDGLVPFGVLTLLGGADTIGKTLFAFEIIRSVQTGQALLGQWAVKTGPVVALPLDDSLSVTLERLDALQVRQHPDLWVADGDAVDLTDPQAMLRALEDEAKSRHARLIVLDALYLLVPASRNAANDAAVMGPLLRTINRIATQTGAGVLLVAHDRKGADDIAGSHVIKAMSKSILRLTVPDEKDKDPDEVPTTPDRILRFQGNLARPATWRLRLEGVGAWTYLGTQREYRGKELEYELLAYLQGGGEGAADEIRKELGKRGTDVRDTLKQLAEAGQIQADEQGTGGRPKTVYRAKTLRPDDPLRPDPPDEKSQGELIDIKTVTGLGGFSSQSLGPRG